jgi:hypothetical protein
MAKRRDRTISAEQEGSRMVVYFPGSILFGFLEANAFCTAMEAISLKLISLMSLAALETHPEPPPSAVRTVSEIEAMVDRW